MGSDGVAAVGLPAGGIDVRSLAGRTAEQDSHLPSYWRDHPVLLPGFVNDSALLRDPSVFRGWCISPVVGRMYMLDPKVGPGVARALRLSDVRQVPRLCDEAEASYKPVTALLNNVDRVAVGVRNLRESMGIDLAWRYDDVVATWSLEGSGIGYHVGHEDGFIVQLAGSRRWRIYALETSEAESCLSVLGDPDFRDHLTRRPDGAKPILDIELQPGDAVAVPALHPHEGTTLGGPSVSLSIGWRGLSVHRLLRESGVIGAGHSVDPGLKASWYGLLPDLPVDEMRGCIAERVQLTVKNPGCGLTDAAVVGDALGSVLAHWDAGCHR